MKIKIKSELNNRWFEDLFGPFKHDKIYQVLEHDAARCLVIDEDREPQYVPLSACAIVEQFD